MSDPIDLAVPGESAFAIDESMIRLVLRARRIREQQLGRDLFSDPAWDLLLEAFAADLNQLSLSEADLCQASPVGPATTLRWIDALERDGWLIRTGVGDAQKLELSPSGSARLRRYFELVGTSYVFT
jgi:hypothetical protein